MRGRVYTGAVGSFAVPTVKRSRALGIDMDDLHDSIGVTIKDGSANLSLPDYLPVEALPRLEQLLRDSVGMEPLVGRHEQLSAVMRGAIVQAVQHMVETGMLRRDGDEWVFRDA